jgi:AcrR family transcriptional regulator
MTYLSAVDPDRPIDRRRMGRPTQAEVAELEERLKQAAVDLFLARGYDGTSMEAVASAAGITRRTLYSRYPDKRSLFVEVITWARTRQAWDQPDFSVDFNDLGAALTDIARSAVARALDPEIVRLDQIVISEANRFPELVIFGSAPMSPRMETVMELLLYHRAAGDISVDDVELAAEQFLAMVSMMPARLAAVGVRRPPEEEERHIQHAVALFRRALRKE